MTLAMTADFVKEMLASEGGVLYFPNCDWLFPNGLKIDNVMVTIGNLDIYWYGFLIALGMLLAMIYGYRKLEKWGLEPDRFTDTALVGLIGGIIGARLYYVVFSIDKYMSADGTLNLASVFAIRDGGLAIYGGIIGALIFGCTMAKIRKVRLAPLLDLVGLGLLIGQTLGRWGNFFNQEAFGAKTTLPWGMTSKSILEYLYFNVYYPDANSVVTNRALDMVAHPCFLYESLWCLLGFILLHIYSKHRKFDGEIFIMYIGWYGLGRFWIEGLRTDSLYIPGTEFRVSQVLAGTCVLFAIALYFIFRANVKKNADYKLYVDTDESKELLEMYYAKQKKSKNKTVNADDACETILDPSVMDDTPEEDALAEEAVDEAAEESVEESVEETAEEATEEGLENE